MPRALEDLVGVGPGGAVGGLDDDLGLDGPGHGGVEDPAERGGDQDVDGHGQQLLVGAGVAPLEADDLAVDGDVLVERGDVDPLGVDDGAVGVGDGEDLAPLLVQEAGGVAADVAVALDGEGGPGDRSS